MANKKVISNEIDQILSTLGEFDNGATLHEIRKAGGINLETRSLQRRLHQLSKDGSITISGNTRSRVYHLPDNAYNRHTPKAIQLVHELSAEILLSSAGLEIKNLVSQPVFQRKPVGYRRDFLMSYRPNVDSYLTDADKDQLAYIGKTNTLQQPAGTYAKSVLERLIIDLSWNSSRLEGNTYSLLDTQYLISKGRAADQKDTADAQMIINHKEAIEFLVQGEDEIGFNNYTITNLHALLSNNLLPDPAASGRLRTFSVGITDSVFTPLAVPQLVDEMFRVILDKVDSIKDPFEQAFFIMVHLPYLQPFDDVNKRVSRLAANIPFNAHNLSPLAFVDVPQKLYIQGLLGVYELNRVDLLKDVFLWSYERSALRYAAIRQSLGEPDPLRVTYRDDIRHIMGEVVKKTLPQEEAVKAIANFSENLPQKDRQKFIEIVDTELLSLHEGNFARFRVSPSEFKKWQQVWKI
ncbi:Fic family protein [Sphingobacterium deserti]|uniref:Filamentation induced by cAMP protein Fic n=1 Tax=Sphingobacterium deserti TaxID=1229276 RepID=A0A0B8T4U0_9SPHI|nr:Fic family protein [Sphingobacterium deserti]KGE15253.1 filamentation induced by cAMP protein Fic [Sphingobacterium deserti]